MTSQIRGGFRRLLIIGAAVPAVAALGVGLTAASASASVKAPGYGHDHECNEVLTYDQEGYYGGWVEVDNVCFAVITHEGGYGRHHRGDLEDVFYATQGRHGQERFHDVFGVRDAEVFR
jgi:hypothetical protein